MRKASMHIDEQCMHAAPCNAHLRRMLQMSSRPRVMPISTVKATMGTEMGRLPQQGSAAGWGPSAGGAGARAKLASVPLTGRPLAACITNIIRSVGHTTSMAVAVLPGIGKTA